MLGCVLRCGLRAESSIVGRPSSASLPERTKEGCPDSERCAECALSESVLLTYSTRKVTHTQPSLRLFSIQHRTSYSSPARHTHAQANRLLHGPRARGHGSVCRTRNYQQPHQTATNLHHATKIPPCTHQPVPVIATNTPTPVTQRLFSLSTTNGGNDCKM